MAKHSRVSARLNVGGRIGDGIAGAGIRAGKICIGFAVTEDAALRNGERGEFIRTLGVIDETARVMGCLHRGRQIVGLCIRLGIGNLCGRHEVEHAHDIAHLVL